MRTCGLIGQHRRIERQHPLAWGVDDHRIEVDLATAGLPATRANARAHPRRKRCHSCLSLPWSKRPSAPEHRPRLLPALDALWHEPRRVHTE